MATAQLSNNGARRAQRRDRQLHLRPALAMVWRGSPRLCVASVVLVVVQGVLPLLALYLMKLIVDAVTAGATAPDRSAALARVFLVVGLAAAVAIITAVCRTIASLIGEAQGLIITDYMQGILHAKSVEVDLEYYENARYYDALHRAQREAPFRPTHVLSGLIQLGQNGIAVVGIAGLLFSFHWVVALVLFAAVVPGILVRMRYSVTMYRWQRERTPTERKSWYINWMLTGDAHAKELRLFGLGPLLMDRYREVRKELRDERLGIARRRSVAELVTEVCATLAVFGAYAFVASNALEGRISLGSLVMYFQAFQRGQAALRDVLSSLAGLYEDNLFLSNLQEFLAMEPKVTTPAHPAPVPRPMRHGIELQNVRFRYPTGTHLVLDGISLRIRPGEVVALVGENGSGKTTLVKLLCRLYDPTEGTITIDGVDLRQFDVTALRREISVIFQDYAHYNLTARENIWFGRVDAPPDQERIVAAARHAGADDVIAGLPRGYDTILGKWFEDGEEISIGQWQKVALARAFLRDAQVIVLDEPTSSMDAKAEFEVFQRLRRLIEGRSAVLISHRFSTVRMADNIYVLDGGRIVEQGTHDDLVRLGGTYARLFEVQARHYR